MQIEELEKEIKSRVLKHFSNTQNIILWASVTLPDFYPKYGDVDVLIVLDKVSTESMPGVIKGLNKLIEIFQKDGIALDPAVAILDDLKRPDFPMLKVDGLHESHSLIQYQIKYMGKVIYGDKKILETIPKITLSQALSDISPYILTNFIGKTRKNLRKAGNVYDFIVENKSIFFVLIRTLYTVEKHEITTKPVAAEYLINTYPKFERLGTLMLEIYKKQNTSSEIDKYEVMYFLDLVEETINN